MEDTQQQKKKSPKNLPNKGINNLGRYSGMAFQMIAIILITTWGGVKLDKISGFEKPVFTIILSLLGVFAAIYTAIRNFIK
jgi:F0F1-type ATP synthase assembly protein I